MVQAVIHAEEWAKRVCRAIGVDADTCTGLRFEFTPGDPFVRVYVQTVLTVEQADAILEDVPIEACEVTLEAVEVEE
jgi:hypothetical protein